MNEEKSFRCHYCKKLNHELTQLPFNQFICDNCIEFKCLNEFKSDDEPAEDLEKINAVGLFMDRIDRHYEKLRIINCKNSNNIGAKLYKIKNRVQDCRDFLKNYEKKINSKLSLVKFELDWNYQDILKKIDKKKMNLLNRINIMENEAIENLKANQPSMKKLIDTFVEKNTAWSNYLNTETMKLKENFDYENYKYSIENQINSILIELNFSKFISLKNFVFKNNLPDNNSFAYLEIKKINEKSSEYESQNEKRNFESIFSMDSILNIKKLNKNVIKSIFTIEYLNQELFVLHYVQNNLSILKIFNKLGELCNELKFDFKVFSIKSNGTSIFVCHQDLLTNENMVKISIFDGRLHSLESKKINFINFSDKYIVDLCIENSKIFLLLTDQKFRLLTVYVLNLNIDLLNSFEIDSSGLVNMNTIDYLKIFTKNQKIYVKQKSLYGSKIYIINLVDGKILKTLFLPYNFLDFFVIELEQKVSKYSHEVNSKIVFFNNSKFYIWDIQTEKIYMKTYFYTSKDDGDKFFNNFCFTKENQIVSLMIE